jgi:hypothetical protein
MLACLLGMVGVAPAYTPGLPKCVDQQAGASVLQLTRLASYAKDGQIDTCMLAGKGRGMLS